MEGRKPTSKIHPQVIGILWWKAYLVDLPRVIAGKPYQQDGASRPVANKSAGHLK
jgi:hypothetical protein